MILSCPICQEIFFPTCEAVVNRCGHMFHLFCLQKWFDSCGKRAKTCPQCRAPALESDVIKIFFNISESSQCADDPATIQFKLDNANFQIQVKEKDLEKARDGMMKEKKSNKLLRKMVLELEQKQTNTESLVAVLKSQIREFSAQNAVIEKYKAENKTLTQELEVLYDLRTVVRASSDDVDKMLENYQNTKALAVIVSTLKKEMVNQNAKREKLEKQIKILKSDAIEKEKKLQQKETTILEYQVKYEEAKRKIERLENSLNCTNESEGAAVDTKKDTLDINKQNFIPKKIHTEDNVLEKSIEDYSSNPIPKLAASNVTNNNKKSHTLPRNYQIVYQSDSLNEELGKARSSKSPYLPVKRRALGSILSIDETGNVKVIKKRRLSIDNFGKYTPLPEAAFDGMGGHPPIENFPKPKKILTKNRKLKSLAPLKGRAEKKAFNNSILDLL